MPSRDVARQVARLAQRLGLDHAMVTEAVTDALTQLISGRNQARTSSLDFPAGARHNAAEVTMPVADPASRRAAPHQALTKQAYEPAAYLASRASKPGSASPCRRNPVTSPGAASAG